MYPLMLLIALLYSVAITAQNTLTYKELLGKELFFDKLADPDNMSCADCHAPEVGFTGPIPSINKHGAVYRGAVPQRFGNRKPPSSAYVTFSPIFHYDESEGIFVGGNFWDGRATGENLGNPAADQALGPFLNPVEQNNASSKAVLEQIAKSKYAWLWEEVWGEPLNLSSSDEVNKNYDRVGLAIAAYEASSEVNAFSSKFDFYNEGLVQLTPQEEWGLELFNGKGKCNLCHTSDGDKPLFTDFTFDNLGAPKNPENPFYDMDKVFLDGGSPINPYGSAWIDGGLGEFLASRADYADKAAENMGKHKVPTLRNVDKRPGNGFTKAYLHNGIFKSLKEVVHFYNTRDVEPWPAPEVADNVNTDELGNLGLTDAEENAIVAFMKTLSDGYKLSNKKAMAYEPNLEIAQELSLHLLGPNPFKDNIQLEYFLPDNAVVEIEAYNITGKKVQTIYAGSQTGGFHYANMKSASMSSGIYIIKLRAGNKTVAQKVVIE
jgi:cytochrome c peroxidase